MINLVALPCLCVDVFDGTDELRAGGEALNFAVHASKFEEFNVSILGAVGQDSYAKFIMDSVSDKRIDDGQGVFHEFTQESVDAMMSSYKETLESIKKGVLYSKDSGDGATYSMIPPTEDVVSDYSVDITTDDGQKVHIGNYSTVEELDEAISDAVKTGKITKEEADTAYK